MNNNDGSLQLYLKLDAIEDGKVIDASGKKINGTITGNPQVIDDRFLGKCLQFDGNLDQIDLPKTAIPIGQEITVSFWANGGDSLPKKKSSIINDKNNGPLRILNIHLPWSDSRIYFDCGNDGNGYDRVYKTASPSEFKGKWSHWTFTKDANKGEMKIYLNGQLWHSETGKNKPIPEINNDVRLGSHNSTERYQGKLAYFRIYNRALSQLEIKQDMAGSIIPGLEDELKELRSLKATWEQVKQGIGDLNSADRPDIPQDIKNILGILGEADRTRQILIFSTQADDNRDRAKQAAQDAKNFDDQAQEFALKASDLAPGSVEAQAAKESAHEAKNAADQAQLQAEQAQSEAKRIEELVHQLVTPSSETPTDTNEELLEQPAVIEAEEPLPETISDSEVDPVNLVEKARQHADNSQKAKEEALKWQNIALQKAMEAAQYAKKAGEYYDNWETIEDIFGFSESTNNGNTVDDFNLQQPDPKEALPKHDNWQVISDLFGLTS
ncbi:MAG: LamG domain-containing protein [Pleurocapsa sp. MO_226.B13]|nr:LamG domain-containing protein [Pleurocapsa sp. MO_226.B13]